MAELGEHRPGTRGRILRADDPEAVDAAIDALSQGDLVGIPTDTVYGVAALANEEGIRRLIHAKRRDPGKGIPLLIDDIEQLGPLVHVPEAARRLAARFWPGPLTLVLPLRDLRAAPALLTGGRPTIGVRVPDHEIPRSLARALGPLAVSSATSRANPPHARSAAAVLDASGERDLRSGCWPLPGGVPSTVVAVTDDGKATVLRQGAIPDDEVLAAAAGS